MVENCDILEKLKRYLEERYERARELMESNPLVRKEIYQEIMNEIKRLENEEEKG